jgi:hypothetical protein
MTRPSAQTQLEERNAAIAAQRLESMEPGQDIEAYRREGLDGGALAGDVAGMPLASPESIRA